MSKTYQNSKIDASGLAVPERVSVAMEEIAADAKEGLLALAVGTGLQVMAAMMEADVTARCGPRGAGRAASTTRTGRRCGMAASAGRSHSVAAGCR